MVAEGGTHHIVTVNPEYVMRARQDPAFARVLNTADLATPDGAGLLIAARILGFRLPQRVTGSDLLVKIAERGATEGWRLFLLGAAPGIAARVATILVHRYKCLRIAGTYAGSPQARDAEHIAALVTEARPHVLLVAFGAPAQDFWIERHRQRLGVPVAIGVGGAFDFVAGTRARAPRWLQRAGLEWLFRLIQEPWRWRRMLALPAFVVQVGRAAWVQRAS